MFGDYEYDDGDEPWSEVREEFDIAMDIDECSCEDDEEGSWRDCVVHGTYN